MMTSNPIFSKLLRSLLALLAFPLTAAIAAGEEGEFRAMWADAWGVGFLNQSQVNQLVADARANNFNAIVVQMRRRADAFYMPSLPNRDPRTTAIASNFDALAALISAAHNSSPRIEVHCWVTTNLVWSHQTMAPPQSSHVFNRRPDFLMESREGEKYIGEGYYVDPGHPEAMREIYDMAVDVVTNYNIDGFHWDYIRYPSQNSGYNPTALARYNEEFGLPVKNRPPVNDSQFSVWRRRQVTEFLRWVNADLLELRPDLAISAAVFSNRTDAYSNRFQHWSAWNADGIIDICMPMTYTSSNSTFRSRVNDARNHQGVRRVYVGPGAYLNTKENTLYQLNYVRSSGFLGTVLYSYRTTNSGTVDRQATLNYIRDQYQPSWKETPELPWKTTTGIAKGKVTDGETGELVYNAHITISGDDTHTQLSCVQGGYAFYNLSGGEWTISATSDGLVASETVNVVPGEVLHVDLVLEEDTGDPNEPEEPETIRLTDFEDISADTGNGEVLFRHPYYSGSTLRYLETSPSSSRISSDAPTGISGQQSLKVDFQFLSGQESPWLRLTTHNTAILPNPIIPFDRALRFDIHTSHDAYIAIGVRDNAATGEIGSDGGETGGIEWVGGTTHNTREGAPLGRFVPAGEWTTLHFDLPNEPVKSFTGNGSLDSTKGTFEHIALVPTNSYPTETFTLYLDNFEVTNDQPGEPSSSGFAGWAEEHLPEDQRGANDDPGGFGTVNLLRYALAMDAIVPKRRDLPVVGQTELIGEQATHHLTLTFTRRTDDPELHYAVEASDDLDNWIPIAGDEQIAPRDEETETVTVIDPQSLDQGTRRFLRLRVDPLTVD